MKNKKNVPDIRFKGFVDEWVETKFEENIRSIQTGTNLLGNTTNNGMPLLKMGNIQRGFFSLDKLEHLDEAAEIELENIAIYGDFFFNTRNTLELVGKGATWIGESGKFAFNSNIARFTFDGVNTLFFNYLYNTNGVVLQVRARAMGTTSVAAIYPNNLSSIEYCLPDISEQGAIGNYFQNIDRLINTSQTKLDKLKNIKKACLEKMFPCNGSTTPELRFKGFTDEWKICELKDICVIKTGYPFNSMDFSNDGDFRVVTNGNIQDNSAIVDNLSGNKVNIYNKQIIEGYGLNIGDVLVTMDGTVGRSAKVADYYMILAQRVGRLIAINNTEFLYQLLNASSFYKEMTAISVGGTIKHISLSDIGSYNTSIPTDVNEQIQLGIFFKNIDDLIVKTEQQINKLKNIKKACLDKMFVNTEGAI